MPCASRAILIPARIEPDKRPGQVFAQFLGNAMPATIHDKPASILGSLRHSLAFDAITIMSVERLAPSAPETRRGR